MSNPIFQNGVYLVEVIEQGFDKATTGTSQFYMKFRLLNAYDPNGAAAPCEQGERTCRHSLKNGSCIRRLQLDLQSAGVQLDDVTRLAPGIPGGISLIGKKIKMTCRLEMFDGQMREHWDILRNERLTLDEIQSLQARFGTVLSSNNGQVATSGNDRAAPAPNGQNDHPVDVDPPLESPSEKPAEPTTA